MNGKAICGKADFFLVPWMKVIYIQLCVISNKILSGPELQKKRKIIIGQVQDHMFLENQMHSFLIFICSHPYRIGGNI